MATSPNVKINFDFSESITGAVIRLQRHTGGLALAMEFGSAIDVDKVQEHVDNFPALADDDIESEIRMLREARTNIARTVLGDMAWLLAADEHLAALEALRNHNQEG